MIRLVVDDMRVALAAEPENSVDACVCDPPYEIGFMSRAWDRSGIAFDADAWRAVLRVLKPGAHLVAFGGTRTWHRITCAIEDAGFEIREGLAWCFGQGFPKSASVEKRIDAEIGFGGDEWHGWGTALKPFFEPVVLARKPLEGTIAANVLKWGTGALAIDRCRIAFAGDEDEREAKAKNDHERFGSGPRESTGIYNHDDNARETWNPAGRWPPNMILDETAAALLDEQSGDLTAGVAVQRNGGGQRIFNHGGGLTRDDVGYPDGGGGASRFCYVAKADASERDAGLEDLPLVTRDALVGRDVESDGIRNPRAGAGRTSDGRRNVHPTVKPVDVMRWLVKLVTPPAGTVLDPFTGSGSTGIAAVVEGFGFLGVEIETSHACVAWHRIDAWSRRALAPGVDGKAAARAIRADEGALDLFGRKS